MPPPRFSARVRSYELDALGHVNHAVYLNWFEQARYDALESAGLPPDELMSRGWGIHVVRIEVDYRAECRIGHEVEVRTVVKSVRNSSMTIEQKLYRRPDVLASEALVTAVWIGRDGRPMRIPEHVRKRFREDGGADGAGGAGRTGGGDGGGDAEGTGRTPDQSSGR